MEKGLKDLLDRAKNDRRVLAVILFGSAARRRAHQGSDTDICLVLRRDSYAPLQLSRIKLEYMRDFNYDIEIFQQLPLYIRRRVLKEGRVLYAANTELLYEVAFAFIREFAHYEHIYREYLEEVNRGG